MTNLRVIVYLNSETKAAYKPIFERIVNLPDSVQIPYSSLVSSLRLLFGRESIVCFEL